MSMIFKCTIHLKASTRTRRRLNGHRMGRLFKCATGGSAALGGISFRAWVLVYVRLLLEDGVGPLRRVHE